MIGNSYIQTILRAEHTHQKKINKVKFCELVEELALVTKHSRKKKNAGCTSLPVACAAAGKVTGESEKSYTCTESLTQSTWQLCKAHWVLVEISTEQWSG